MKEKDIKPYMGYDLDQESYQNSRGILREINSSYTAINIEKLRPYLKHIGENAVMIPPLYFDHGIYIDIGDNFYSNTDLTILDEALVKIGDNVLFGPKVQIYTPSHPLDKEIRRTGLEYALPIIIEDDVWIGGNTVILGGITIKSGSIIGAGSVVTKDIPENVIACGNPCKVIRAINKEDKIFWKQKYDEYKGANK